ncbi:hypothetical protein GALMADRAFT_206166 [Galerina marginata CBS 339.88]|uniref:Uncharacterized protein n=1 Tax=Galerina marginata (strain CBS 339.88) TaxID=685588 RepID=A0A067TQM8_GALM3|nr:hypothetical protein GALMADRAFT_206166 [Galerina marginata CBS 339.88]
MGDKQENASQCKVTRNLLEPEVAACLLRLEMRRGTKVVRIDWSSSSSWLAGDAGLHVNGIIITGVLHSTLGLSTGQIPETPYSDLRRVDSANATKKGGGGRRGLALPGLRLGNPMTQWFEVEKAFYDNPGRFGSRLASGGSGGIKVSEPLSLRIDWSMVEPPARQILVSLPQNYERKLAQAQANTTRMNEGVRADEETTWAGRYASEYPEI